MSLTSTCRDCVPSVDWTLLSVSGSSRMWRHRTWLFRSVRATALSNSSWQRSENDIYNHTQTYKAFLTLRDDTKHWLLNTVHQKLSKYLTR